MKNHMPETNYFPEGESITLEEINLEKIVLGRLKEMVEEKRAEQKIVCDKEGKPALIKIFALDGELLFFLDLARMEKIADELTKEDILLHSSLRDQ